jgi:putative membrane protein (TIGR04086 family)
VNPINRMEKVQERISSPILAGLVAAVLVMLAGVLVFSLILAGTGVTEDSVPAFVMIIHGLALLCGGYTAGRKKGTKGWSIGGLLGIIYWLMILLIGYLSIDAAIGQDTLITAAICLASGALGGIVGVNRAK